MLIVLAIGGQSAPQAAPPRHRIVLVLIDIEELSYEEAAEALAIPVGAIKSRLARARLQMRSILQTSTAGCLFHSRSLAKVKKPNHGDTKARRF